MTRFSATPRARRRIRNASRKSWAPTLLKRGAQTLCGLALLGWSAPIFLSERSPESLLREGLMRDFQTQAAQPGWLELEMDVALAAGDVDDALLLKESADLAGLALPQRQLDRLAAETTPLAQARRTAYACGRGFVLGAGEGAAGIGCAVVSDFSVVGDLRDLARELPKENPNDLIVGLAAVGLALEAGTLISLGAAAPAKAGVSMAKSAARAGLISGPLTRELRMAVGEAVDLNRLRRGARIDEAGSFVRAEGLQRLTRPMSDLKSVYDVGGWRAARQALKISDSADDVADAARAARTLGPQAAPVLRVIGKGALRGTKIVLRGSWRIAGAIFAAVTGLFQLLLTIRALIAVGLRAAWWSLKRLVGALGLGANFGAAALGRASAAPPAPHAPPQPAPALAPPERAAPSAPPALEALLRIPAPSAAHRPHGARREKAL